MIAITIEELKEALSYDPETGIWIWLTGPKKGNNAGWINDQSTGYLRCIIKGKKYYLHRLAVFYMTGEMPVHQVDHANLKTGDNRWDNLRQATNSQNLANRPKYKNNIAGLKGVSSVRTNSANKWRARIRVNDQEIYLGVFDCKVAAHLKYVVEANRHYGEFSRAS